MEKTSRSPIGDVTADDTIVAIATPLGEGGLGVVRLSGPLALSIATRIFQTHADLQTIPTHTLHLGWIKKKSESIDQVVLSIFRSPHSYTGEDVIEFSCHGSPAVLKEIVSLCETHGARLAAPGEFTQRAYMNGKLDLSQAEAVADLIHAQSAAARSAASDHLRGILSVRIKSIRDEIIRLLAHVEANLDFVEEDLPGLARQTMGENLLSVKKQIDDLLSTSLRGRLLREGLRIAIVGRPNVGKSSLFNALLASERAIVTNVPGTTRDTLDEKLQWDGFPVTLTDTAGLRSTVDEVEALGVDRSRQAVASAQVILFVVDGSLPLTAEDEAVALSLKGKKIVFVLNKNDAGLVVKEKSAREKWGFRLSAAVSAKTGAGLTELKKITMASLDQNQSETESSVVITNMRHVTQLDMASSLLQKAIEALAAGRSEESFSIDLRKALDALGAITGESVTEDVLSSIFNQFCIGK